MNYGFVMFHTTFLFSSTICNYLQSSGFLLPDFVIGIKCLASSIHYHKKTNTNSTYSSPFGLGNPNHEFSWNFHVENMCCWHHSSATLNRSITAWPARWSQRAVSAASLQWSARGSVRSHPLSPGRWKVKEKWMQQLRTINTVRFCKVIADVDFW